MGAPSASSATRGSVAKLRVTEDEPALVARARNGDRAAFDELVRRHADGLYAVILCSCADRDEAEEVTQEAFLRAWRGLPAFRGEARFFTWLYRIGVNEARRRADGRRRHQDVIVVSLDEQREHASGDRSVQPLDRAEQADLRGTLDAAIAALPVDQRAALVLRDVEGLSTAQAAAVLGLREAAFKSRLHRARELLRAGLADHARQRGAS